MQDLNSIHYQKYTPSAPLSKYVQAIWLANKADNTQILPFKILSDCSASVIYNFSQFLTLERGNESANVDSAGVVIGPAKDLLKMTFQGPVNALGVHFLASGGHVFFSKNMDALANQFDSHPENSFRCDNALSKKLHNLAYNTSPQALVKLVEEHLLKELADYQGQAQHRLTCLMRMIEQEPNYSIQELADNLKVSVREVQRIFKQYVGVSPKTFLRVNKINQLKGRIANNDFSTLTELAIESGYFDQAHFIRDFKLFMQATPGQYQKLKQP